MTDCARDSITSWCCCCCCSSSRVIDCDKWTLVLKYLSDIEIRNLIGRLPSPAATTHQAKSVRPGQYKRSTLLKYLSSVYFHTFQGSGEDSTIYKSEFFLFLVHLANKFNHHAIHYQEFLPVSEEVKHASSIHAFACHSWTLSGTFGNSDKQTVSHSLIWSQEFPLMPTWKSLWIKYPWNLCCHLFWLFAVARSWHPHLTVVVQNMWSK